MATKLYLSIYEQHLLVFATLTLTPCPLSTSTPTPHQVPRLLSTPGLKTTFPLLAPLPLTFQYQES